jgi:hypothetical protein
MVSRELILVIIVVALVVIIVIGKCTLPCNRKEGYRRAELACANNCLKNRSPVDYYSDYTANPHYKANPSSKYQMLEQGPVDFFTNQRELYAGTVGDDFLNTWEPGFAYSPNNSKTRSDLDTIGSTFKAKYLRDRPLKRVTPDNVAEARMYPEIYDKIPQDQLHDAYLDMDFQHGAARKMDSDLMMMYPNTGGWYYNRMNRLH